MQRRPYGRGGEDVSIIGLGGIVVKERPQAEATAIVCKALDRGVTYFDVGPGYGDPELLLGPALDGVARDSYFLACKTARRDAKGAREDLERSLRRLHTDHFDVYQLHNCARPEDVERTLGPGGALETLVRAREQGLTRHVGFSTHDEEAGCRLLDAFEFDSVLMPVNWVCILRGTCGPKLLARCREKGVTFMALKAMARTNWDKPRHPEFPFTWYRPETDPEFGPLALRFALGQGVATAIPPGAPGLFFRAVDVAENYRPLSDEELARLKDRAQQFEPIFPKE